MKLADFTSYCKDKGFVFPSSEIYGGISGFFDYGHLGVQLKKNIIDSYWRNFVLKNENIISQDGSIISHPRVWAASGHIENFSDPIICTKNHRYRADHFIEESLNIAADGLSVEEIQNLIRKNNLKYLGEEIISVERKNLMLSTNVGTETGNNTYLRPETCQAIFCNAKYLANVERLTIPFGIVQIGKAFRNEIAPRNFIFRCREFEQMEMEYFFDPFSKCDKPINLELPVQCLFSNSESISNVTFADLQDKVNSHHLYWIYSFYVWLTETLGLKKEKLRLREHHKTELSHYSSATFDIDYLYPFSNSGETGGSFKELCGIANRGNYDLSRHAEFSKKNLYMKNKNGENVYAHVIEPSIGLDRLFMALLCDAYEYDLNREYIVLHLTPKLCPVEYAVFPLFSKSNERERYIQKAREVFIYLIDKGYRCIYDQSGSIGKRYARQDEIGTFSCITVDEISLSENTVTVRNRDTKDQVRVSYTSI
jgi:glycyl-tRNA synthetase